MTISSPRVSDTALNVRALTHLETALRLPACSWPAFIDVPEYDQKRKDRLKVKPGITGYTQAYYRNNISQEDKLALDAKYAQKVTFLGDLKIFFKTIETVVCRKNVYTN